MPSIRLASAVAAALVLLCPATGALAPAQKAAGIGPGSHLVIDEGGQTLGCTAGWVFRDAQGYLLSMAGHCLLPSGATATDGPGADAAKDAIVRVCVDQCQFGGQTGFVITGTLVQLGPVAYARQTQDGIDIGNDFGLVRIPSYLNDQVRTNLPSFGYAGRTATLGVGDITCFYGNGVGVGETFVTMAREGAGLMTQPDGSWYMAAPSMEGDSGSAVATCTPNGVAIGAVGVLTHLAAGMIAGTTIAKAQTMATQAGLHVQPVL